MTRTIKRAKIRSVITGCYTLDQLKSAENYIRLFQRYYGKKHAHKYWCMIIDKENQIKSN